MDLVKVALEPSMQGHNQYCCSGDTENYVMYDYSLRVRKILQDNGVDCVIFWNGPPEDNYVSQTEAAQNWGADYLISFHTDSAGNQNNDGRGYTGSLLCYHGQDPEGRDLGRAMQRELFVGMGWPNAGERDRQGTLAVLDNFYGPSLLLEIGNHSDPEDCRALLDRRQEFCNCIAYGILSFLGIKPKEENVAIIPFGTIGRKVAVLAASRGFCAGWPLTGENDCPGGRFQQFSNCIVFWQKAIDMAFEVHGDIGVKYASLGSTFSFLGLPTSDEMEVPGVPGARMNTFQHGSIYWSLATKAHEVHGAILAEYIKQGGAAKFGLPITDEYQEGIGRQSDFQHGSIYWQDGKGCTVTIK